MMVKQERLIAVEDKMEILYLEVTAEYSSEVSLLLEEEQELVK